MKKTTREYIDKHVECSIRELKRLTSQPSISAQRIGTLECSELVAEEMSDAGLNVEILPTADSDYPVVFGEAKGTSDYTLLFYNHYDVHPPEPLELWDSPPFEPTERNGYIIGRGISDDKGPFIARLAALKALRDTEGALPINVKFILEGAEEIGSPGFREFVESNTQRLRSNACIWEGGGVNWDNRPLITLGVKGLLYVELECQTATTDTHSSYAPVVPNPAWRLIWALNTLKDSNDRIHLRNFYEQIRPALEEELNALKKLPDEVENYKKAFGVEMFVGEATGYEFRRKLIMEPSMNIDGIVSGYTGSGAKTITPSLATVKLDFRLVPDQDPIKILDDLRTHLNEHGFSDIKLNVFSSVQPARTPINHPFVSVVSASAQRIYGSEPYVQPNMPGTGPQYIIQQILSVPVASSGIDYPGNRIHAPNENIRRDLFRPGIMHAADLLTELGKLGER